MRIVHLIDTLGHGGAQSLLANLTRQQAAKHEVHVIHFLMDRAAADAFAPTVGLHRIPLDWRFFPALRKLLRRLAPDLVHSHLTRADFFGLAACVGLPLKRFCTLHQIRLKWDWRDTVYFLAYRLHFKTLARDCQVLCVSQAVMRHARIRLGLPESRLRLAPNGIPAAGVSASREELRARHSIPADSFCVLFLGRLGPQKSVDTLLRALALAAPEIPGLKALIVGDGESRESLLALRKELGLVELAAFPGATRNPESYYPACDVLVLPSVAEAFGLVILEAFQADLPVIASDIDGPRELIRHEENGLLVPPRNPDALARALVRASRDPDLRQRLAAQGRKDVLDFGMDKCAERVEAIYREGPEKADGRATSRS